MTQINAWILILSLAVAQISKPKARIRQFLSHSTHELAGSTAKSWLKVIQTKNTAIARTVASAAGSFRSLEHNQAMIVSTATSRLIRIALEIGPYTSRCGCINVIHTQVRTPAKGWRSVRPRQAR